MKRVLITLSTLCLALVAMAQQGSDPVVMRINGEPVTRSEFEYNYNKNNTEGVIDRQSVDEYAEMFINYKLKVWAAKDARLDTLSSYQQEFRTYRDQQIRPLLVDSALVEGECRRYYAGMLESLGGKDLILPAHIFLRVLQNASPEEQAAAKTRIDSIYNELQHGADFAELARKHSDDKQTAVNGGALPYWIGPGQTVKEFEEAAYATPLGQYSAPVLSTVGYHIIRLNDRKDLEPYDTLQPQILRYLQSRGIEDQLATQVLDSLAQAAGQGVTAEEILDRETERLCAQDLDLKYLVQEYHDGLLLYEECNREVWEPASRDTMALDAYFRAHRGDYAWEKPHFRGMVYYCKNKADVKKVKKLLKGLDDSLWTTTVREHFNKDSVTVRMEKRIFVQGDNANVDKLALKVKGAQLKPIKDYEHVGVVGTALKKGPADWTDVAAQVREDYQRQCENEFVARLRNKYAVEVYKDVLQTVNNH